MEYGLRPVVKIEFVKEQARLNPYSIGIWSATLGGFLLNINMETGLNPYSIGIWSATVAKNELGYYYSVS